MNDNEGFEALKTLAQSAALREGAVKPRRLASVRVSPGGYLAVASVLTFCSVLLLQRGNDQLALILVVVAWLVLPSLAFLDRIVFDGHHLARRGPMPFLTWLATGTRERLSIADIERVDTSAVRTLRSGGRVRYRYRTQITGKGMNFVIASGGRSYRRMMRQLLPLLHDQKVDGRTQELRDHLCEPAVVVGNSRQLHLASPTVLDNAASQVRSRIRSKRAAENYSEDDLERAVQLRRLGNQLRIVGRLREAR